MPKSESNWYPGPRSNDSSLNSYPETQNGRMHRTTHSLNQPAKEPRTKQVQMARLATRKPFPKRHHQPTSKYKSQIDLFPHPHACSRSKWIAVCSIELLIQKYRTRDYLSSPRRTCSSSSHCASRRRSPLRQAEDGTATACEARIKPPGRENGPPPAREVRCRPPRSLRDSGGG